MLRLDSWLGDETVEYDHEILTIEHVLPQTVTLAVNGKLNGRILQRGMLG